MTTDSVNRAMNFETGKHRVCVVRKIKIGDIEYSHGCNVPGNNPDDASAIAIARPLLDEWENSVRSSVADADSVAT